MLAVNDLDGRYLSRCPLLAARQQEARLSVLQVANFYCIIFRQLLSSSHLTAGQDIDNDCCREPPGFPKRFEFLGGALILRQVGEWETEMNVVADLLRTGWIVSPLYP